MKNIAILVLVVVFSFAKDVHGIFGMQEVSASLQATRELNCENGHASMSFDPQKAYSMLHTEHSRSVLLGEWAYLAMIIRPISSEDSYSATLHRSIDDIENSAARVVAVKDVKGPKWLLTDACVHPVFGDWQWILAMKCTGDTKFDVSFSFESAHADDRNEVVVPPQTSLRLIALLQTAKPFSTIRVNFTIAKSWPSFDEIQAFARANGECGDANIIEGKGSHSIIQDVPISQSGSQIWSVVIHNGHNASRNLVTYQIGTSEVSEHEGGDPHWNLYTMLAIGDQHLQKGEFFAARRAFLSAANDSPKHPAPFMRMTKLLRDYGIQEDGLWNSWLPQAAVNFEDEMRSTLETLALQVDNRWSTINNAVSAALYQLTLAKHRLAHTISDLHDQFDDDSIIDTVIDDLVIESRPADRPGVLFSAAQLLRNVGQHDKALTVLEKAIQIAPENPSFYNAYAELAQFSDRFDVAEHAFDKSIGLNPNEPMTHFSLARLILHVKEDPSAENIEKALSHLKTFDDLTQSASIPTATRVASWDLAGYAHYLLGNYPNALELFLKSHNGDHPFAISGAAMIALKMLPLNERDSIVSSASAMISKALDVDQGHDIPRYLRMEDAIRYLSPHHLKLLITKLKPRAVSSLNFDENSIHFGAPLKIALIFGLSSKGSLANASMKKLASNHKVSVNIYSQYPDNTTKLLSSDVIAASEAINQQKYHICVVVDATLSKYSSTFLMRKPCYRQIFHAAAGFPVATSHLSTDIIQLSDKIISPPEYASNSHLFLPSLFFMTPLQKFKKPRTPVVATVEDACDVTNKTLNAWKQIVKNGLVMTLVEGVQRQSRCFTNNNALSQLGYPQAFVRASSIGTAKPTAVLDVFNSVSPPSDELANLMGMGSPLLTVPQITTTSRVFASLGSMMNNTVGIIRTEEEYVAVCNKVIFSSSKRFGYNDTSSFWMENVVRAFALAMEVSPQTYNIILANKYT